LKINKNYKSSVFTTLFGTEEKIIELYSAIEGKPYPENAEIKINTLHDALFMDRLNDVSFTIDDKLVVLVEHQSTINENIYRKSLVTIPTPEFIVLYNGNINKGHNTEIAARSKTLDDYISFIDRIRENLKSGMVLDGAITEAVKFCIGSGILQDFLETIGSEVANMLNVEWNWDDAFEVAREEARDKKALDIAKNLLKRNRPIDEIMEDTGLTEEEIKSLISAF